ncbi:MAG: hypothetical protein ACTSYD_14335 [Candidatus Heimdallarchaeaceae archaeon]
MLDAQRENIFVEQIHVKVSTILLLVFVDAFVYYIPIRNSIYIGKLFGISLWFYFGLLNGLLIILIYVFVKGEVIIDFDQRKIIFSEFKNRKEWNFNQVLGLYLLTSDYFYILRIRPKRLMTLDIKLQFDQAYDLLSKFSACGIKFDTVKRRVHYKGKASAFPILLSKYERKRDDFNPELGEWDRRMTLRNKWLSISFAPHLYIVGATLVLRIPHLLEGLSKSKVIVSMIYGFTAFVLFDGGLYFLFGVSILMIIAKQLIRIIYSSPAAK